MATPPAPSNEGPIYRFWASQPCGPAGWLARLLIKAGDVETNQSPTTTRKQVGICGISHRHIHVRRQILIRCNRIEHWVHLRCAGIRLAQYTDTCTCHIYIQRIQNHNTYRHNTTPPSQTQATHPHHRNPPHYMYNKHLHRISPRCLTHYTIGHRGQLNTHYHQNTSHHITINIRHVYRLQQNRRTFTNYKANWTRFTRHRVRFRSDHHTHQHTHCQQIFHKHHTDGRQAHHTKG